MSRRGRKYRLRVVLTPRGMGSVAVAFALCGYLATPQSSPDRAQIIWNVTASAPIGLYRVIRQPRYLRGDLVLVKASPSVAKFAAQRGYLPAGVPLVKRIAAIAGDTVCAGRDGIFIDGQFVVVRLAADSAGRSLPSWSGCRTLKQDEVFLLMEGVRISFDGRYFGPTSSADIIGQLDPIWVR
ncbi:MAG TPA: S26 family signal peptidase [Terriglobales bacterium]|nr:S26 family signal peptidase [Terriglobales bacterium]